MTMSAGPPPTPPSALPGSLHRLDWRFLLHNPGLQRAAYVGREQGALLEALRSLYESLDVLDPNDQAQGARGSSTTYGLVIACGPSRAELRLAAERVEPGGTLIVESRGLIGLVGHGPRTLQGFPRAWRNLWLPGQIAREVSRLGFEDVRSFWHWPTIDRCTQIIPMNEPLAVQCALSRTGKGLGNQARAQAGRWLLGVGLIEWVAVSTSVVGTRTKEKPGSYRHPAGHRTPPRLQESDPSARSSSMVHAFLDECWERLDMDRYFGSRRVPFVILTPRFGNSSHLVFLLLPEGRSEPVLVAKVPRFAGRCETIEHEAQILGQIQALRAGGFDSIPRLIAFEETAGHKILIETAVRGRALDRSTLRRNARAACEATIAWLTEVEKATLLAPGSEPDWFERLVERPIRHLETVFPAEAGLIARTRELCLPLSTARLTLVLEHGDLSHPNLLWSPEGRIAVIDWELGEPHGLPATDLFFFLTYVARALSRAQTSAQSVAALDHAFFQPRSWARTHVERYARSMALAEDVLTPLFVAGWVRQVSGLARRMAAAEKPSSCSTGGVADRIDQDWRFAAWRHGVEQAHRLRWDELPHRR